ncbi:hypothetical protein [Croceiramulus getboli]|nr:hypothetical protein P8624_00840 [Flavobacteriaceae bacterium YJPT1-3]
MRISLLAIVALFLTACNTTPNQSTTNEPPLPVEADGGIGDGAPSLPTAFAMGIEKAHEKDTFSKHQAVSFHIDLNFGGQDRMDGTVTMTTDSKHIRVDREDGISVVFNDGEMSLSPEGANYPGARFDVLTWPYFFALPFKLTDPGTHWQQLEEATTPDAMMRAKLTFGENVGDAPDDWYWVYADQETQLLHMAGYIVTVNKSVEKAEENPHAIVYSNYQVIDGVPFAAQWEFFNWSVDQGLNGDPIGSATLSNIQFTSPDPQFFEL